MKQESTLKLTEKFDQELLAILTEDLKMIRNHKQESPTAIYTHMPIAS